MPRCSVAGIQKNTNLITHHSLLHCIRFLSTPIPFSVTDFQPIWQCFFICVILWDNIKTAETHHYALQECRRRLNQNTGLVPPFVSAITRNGGNKFGS